MAVAVTSVPELQYRGLLGTGLGAVITVALQRDHDRRDNTKRAITKIDALYNLQLSVLVII